MQKAPDRVVRMGMIGVGGWGTAGHLQAYADSPLAQVVAVCDTVADRAAEVAETWGVEQWFDDYREMLRHPEVEAVDVCTPNNTHREIVLAALAAGKHVLCEKPIANTVSDAVEMVNAAAEAGVRSSINFVHRYVPSARYVKQLLDEGALGEIHHVNVTYEQGWLTDPKFPRVWRLNKEVAGTGVLGDLGCHIIDLARWWLGSEIAEVSARLRTFHERRPAPTSAAATMSAVRESYRRAKSDETVPIDVDDAATWLATFQNGAEGLFFTSRNATAHANHQRAEIYGSDGAIVFENGVRDSIQASLGAAMWRRNAWATLPVPLALMRENGKNSMHYFVQDIATGSRIGPTFEDGLRAQQVMEAIERSAESRCWSEIRYS